MLSHLIGSRLVPQFDLQILELYDRGKIRHAIRFGQVQFHIVGSHTEGDFLIFWHLL